MGTGRGGRKRRIIIPSVVKEGGATAIASDAVLPGATLPASVNVAAGKEESGSVAACKEEAPEVQAAGGGSGSADAVMEEEGAQQAGEAPEGDASVAAGAGEASTGVAADGGEGAAEGGVDAAGEGEAAPKKRRVIVPVVVAA